MNSLKRFWNALETLPTLAAVEAEWIDLVGGEYSQIKPLLHASKDRADSYPNLNGGLPYRVVEHGPDDLVGVCPETGDTIQLQRKQLVVYRLGVERLARRIAGALGLSTANPVDANNTRLFRIGSIRPTGASLAAFLILPRDPDDILTSTATLVSLGQSPLVVPVR
jgi:hypothetical protein